MDKKTLTTIALFAGITQMSSIASAIDLQDLKIIKEEKVSAEEFQKALVDKVGQQSSYSNWDITASSYSNWNITAASYSNWDITSSSYSNWDITSSSYSNWDITSASYSNWDITGGDIVSQKSVSQGLPSPKNGIAKK